MAGISLQRILSRSVLPESTEQQLLYVLLEANPEGAATQRAKLPLNLCLVLDRSSSMRGERLLQVKDAANRIIDQLNDEDYFSLVTFNDRADVVVPAQRVVQRADLKQAVGRIEASGGTEMANGLAMAAQEIQRPLLSRSISRILLLTDGRTYGDEGRCIEIVRRVQDRGIGLTALGIGTEWNEDLLETMTARGNSRACYIESSSEISQVFADEVQRMHSTFAQRVQFQATVRPGAILRSIDRVEPFIAAIPSVEEAEQRWSASLGDWPSVEVQRFLIEIVVPPLTAGDYPLLKIDLRYDLPGNGLRDQTANLVVRVNVRQGQSTQLQVDPTVKYWLERLVAYRLQSRAWQDVAAGRIEDATQRLKMAGTRLLGAGEKALAQTVQEEATRLLQNGSASDEGRKRIRFGTRGLMGDGSMEERGA